MYADKVHAWIIITVFSWFQVALQNKKNIVNAAAHFIWSSPENILHIIVGILIDDALR